MSRSSAEHAEPIFEPSLSLIWHELTILAEFLSNIRLARILPFELDGRFVGWGKLPRDEAFLSDLLDVLLLPLLLLFPGEVLD